MDFLFDGQRYLTFQNRHEGPDAWPFDQPFHLLMNIAAGGNWGGKMGVDTAVWPQKMLVDYVRVFQ
jgi:beta-glucanase (GH16 family)